MSFFHFFFKFSGDLPRVLGHLYNGSYSTMSVYFKKIKHPGLGRIIKSAFFNKKLISLHIYTNYIIHCNIKRDNYQVPKVERYLGVRKMILRK